MTPARRLLRVALLALVLLYAAWFGADAHWVALAVFALPPLLFALLVLALWQLGVRAADVEESTLPAPTEVFGAMWEMRDLLVEDGWITVKEIVVGYLLLIALGVGIAIYINTYSAIRGVDNALVEAATTLGASRAALIWHVILPGSLPGFLVGLRLALSGAWLSLIFAETINTTEGIGYLMTRAQNLLQSEVSVLILVIYAVIGMISYAFVRFLERRLLAWRPGFQGT